MNCSTPGFTVLHHLPEFVHCLSDAIQPLYRSLLHLLSISPSITVFSSKSALHIRWPKYWSFSISPSNEYSGLIFFRIDWFDVLAVHGTLMDMDLSSHGEDKSLLQHHSLKASILWGSDFFMVQLSHLYMATGKTIALTIWTFVSKMMSLLFNMLSWFVIVFLPRIKCLLFRGSSHCLQWFWSPRKENLSLFPFLPIYLPWSDGTGCSDLSFLNVEF